MHIGWPQGIYLALIFMGIEIAVSKYGKQKLGTYGIWEILIGPVMVLSLLWWGGFFK